MLRFAEFSGEWQLRKLEDFIIEHRGGAPLTPNDFTKNSKCEVIPKKGITSGGELILSLDEPTFCTESFFHRYSKSVVDDSYLITTLRDLVPSGPNIGYIVKNNSKNSFMLAQGVYGLKINKQTLFEDFLIQFSNTESYRKLMQTIMVGSTQVHIRNSTFFGISIYTPELPEQTQIATSLKTVDGNISQLNKKKALLEQYKKGVMKQLLSQKLRFKDEEGNDYPDWEEKKLEEIADVKGGKRIPKGFSLETTDNGYPYITVSDMENGSVSMEKIQFVPLSVVKIISNYTISTKDIFVSVAGTLGLIGTIPEVLENANLTENANKITNIKCNQGYLLHYLKSDYFKKLIDSVKTIGAQPKLAIYAINGFIVSVPSLPEQQKIASFLSALDDKIAQTALQIEKMQLWKKGLLQQMFV